MQWGTARNLASNVVRGVSERLHRQPRDQRCRLSRQADAKNLKLQLGFSHDVEVPIPTGIQIKAIKPTRDRDHRRGPPEGRAACGRDPQPAPARALQGQGHQVLTEKIRRKEGKKK